jgi:peptidoglycan hydrolase-like protein with peptidoglycan-binding domain
MRKAGRVWVVVAALVGLTASACSDGGPSEIERTAASIAAAASRATEPTMAPATTVTTSAATSTSAATVTTQVRATTPTAAPAGLATGARGAEVAALERKLDSLHYDVGAVDDLYDQNTAYGVMAFQKVTGMGRTGRATDDVVAALASATSPPALVPNGGSDRVEIDIPRQVLFLYKANTLQKVLTISSGNNQRFCSEGYCRKAVTPGGSFGIYRQGRGWEYGALGGLYNPAYFNGGIAIHGSKSVPGSPASHGCIRIPMAAAEWFPGQVSIGMAVHVVGVPGEPPTPGISLASPATTAPATTAPPTPPTTVQPAFTPPTVATIPDLLGSLLRPQP